MILSDEKVHPPRPVESEDPIPFGWLIVTV